MKKIIPICLLLCGCSTDITENISKTAQEQLKTLKGSITPECKNESIVGQINNIESTIQNMNQSCELEKDLLENKILIRDFIIGLLILGIAGYIFAKLKLKGV